MSTYTAEDFAAVRLAENPETGKVAVRDRPESVGSEWSAPGDGFVSDAKMAEFGWVPIVEAGSAAAIKAAALREVSRKLETTVYLGEDEGSADAVLVVDLDAKISELEEEARRG